MLFPSLSVPTGLSNFFTNRRRTFTWVATTVGGAYLLGQWGFRKVEEAAERSRRERLDKDNLARRFNLNLQDCQFTVLALLPTLSSQVLASMDVEAVSAELAQVAARAKARERALSEANERGRLALLEPVVAAAAEDPPEEVAMEEVEANVEEAPVVGGGRVHSPMLNPAAAAFVPSWGKVAVQEDCERDASENGQAEDQKSLQAETEVGGTDGANGLPAVDGHAEKAGLHEAAGHTADEAAVAQEHSPTSSETTDTLVASTSTLADETTQQRSAANESLGKSWAQVVAGGQTNEKPSELQAIVVAPEPPTNSVQLPLNVDVSPPEPEPSRAELWNEIKIISFTRTITSLYMLTLLTLQTHVQLNLLGRASYVSSVLTSLPASSTSSLALSMSNTDDLERALFDAHAEKAGGTASGGVSAETKRKYLTLSWWLLHRGWKEVGARVRSAVEEVVGPMPLKSSIVYGELSVLLGQIRHKIDFNPNGSHYDFSPVLFPPTPADELAALSAGGLPSTALSVSPELRTLLDETSDFLDAPDCVRVRAFCLDRLFSQLLSAMEGPFRPPRRYGAGVGVEQGSRFEDVTERTARLASLLPTVARQTHLALNGMLPNEYVESLEEIRELGEFSAIIYSSFDKENARASC